ncbi:MAG TPA: chondroitinase-B domain-containing protein, partial [Armatimonadota bacterium]|nr:chondroitinase-B domain-containing protein [Armatimonadota bacterium]
MMRRLMLTVALMVACLATADAATYYVDGRAEDASDENAGTEGEPWETMARAGAAEELKPGDTVLVADGVYRESVHITVSGEEGNPITFAAAPGARVVIKGSEIVRGDWERVSDLPDMEEPFPNAFTGLWRVTLGDEYFTDPDFEHSYTDVAKRWVSQVYLQDRMRLQQIGPDRIYTSEEYVRLVTVGRGIEDMIDGSFYFDAAEQMLYMKQGGSPSWYTIEMGVRGWVLKAV